MKVRISVIGAALGLTFGVEAFAQLTPGAAFTAAGESCDQVMWSDATLAQYPRIASACQEVMERDGDYFVRFEGEVRSVADRGRQVTIAFEDGDTLELMPPENLVLTIDGRLRSPRDLRPGDELTFYVPQDRLTATFFAGEPETSEQQEVPISRPAQSAGEMVAQSGAPDSQPARLPRTAGFVPLMGIGGLALVSLGGMLMLGRRLRA